MPQVFDDKQKLGRTGVPGSGDYRPVFCYMPTTRAELMKIGQGVRSVILGEDEHTVQVYGFINKQDAEQQVKTLPTYLQLKNAPHFTWLRLGGAIKLYNNRYEDRDPTWIPFGTAIWIKSMDAIDGWGQITFWTDSPQAHVEGYIDEATSRKLVNVL
eukprot:gnl/TRDRNA2_/TRDRNA2_174686_c0_seq19.p1 gnl/TRDRNA2_/TRDRNA2_174686_c0~~gnl/TRDRNA2_/TRDRNA2_174686_c0_seq19.p1  ORF type:complete len:157 (-),score=15.24 gnl/TRDRNA2_/TRDRNA2_174686_c0_seq19:90-560(-)